MVDAVVSILSFEQVVAFAEVVAAVGIAAASAYCSPKQLRQPLRQVAYSGCSYRSRRVPFHLRTPPMESCVYRRVHRPTDLRQSPRMDPIRRLEEHRCSE